MSRIGVDVGGTFTDLVLFEPETGRLRILKTPSTPAHQFEGVASPLRVGWCRRAR